MPQSSKPTISVYNLSEIPSTACRLRLAFGDEIENIPVPGDWLYFEVKGKAYRKGLCLAYKVTHRYGCYEVQTYFVDEAAGNAVQYYINMRGWE